MFHTSTLRISPKYRVIMINTQKERKNQVGEGTRGGQGGKKGGDVAQRGKG